MIEKSRLLVGLQKTLDVQRTLASIYHDLAVTEVVDDVSDRRLRDFTLVCSKLEKATITQMRQVTTLSELIASSPRHEF